MDILNNWSTGLALLLGVVSAYLAKRRGANPWVWFALGSFLGVFGIAWLFFSTPLPRKRSESTLPQRINESSLRSLPSPYWYYLQDRKKSPEGPVSPSYLQKLFLEKKITQETLIWNEGFKQWKSLKAFIITER